MDTLTDYIPAKIQLTILLKQAVNWIQKHSNSLDPDQTGLCPLCLLERLPKCNKFCGTLHFAAMTASSYHE